MKNKKASIFIYSILLVTLALSLWLMIMNNSSILISNQNYYEKERLNYNNINSKIDLFQKKIIETNSDWSWFIDNIWCPKDFTMSWTTVKWTNIDTSLIFSGSLYEKFYCSWFFNWYKIKFFFNSNYDDFNKAEYKTKNLVINSWSLSWNFSDSENTLLDLENKNNYYYSDNIDDNFNSDNYIWTNSWITYYPENYEDNDDFVRKNINGLVIPNSIQNIFWNNHKIEKYIDKNINNTWSLNINLWKVENWNLFLEINNNLDFKIIEYSKQRFQNFNEIKKNYTYTWSISWSWYIEKIWNTLSLNTSTGANTYNFDFKNLWYIFFLENKSSSDFISYNLSWINNTWSGIFLNPINDTGINTFSALGYDVLISEKWTLSSKILEIVKEK